MLQKDSVISWFRGLSGDDRIDLMCNLLDCSLPWEIRFYNTFLDAQFQRDYTVFRQAESAANNPVDLSCLFGLDDAHIRRKLCVSLALLHSSNRQAAAVLFGILNDFQPLTLDGEEFFSELSLLMTMCAHHPAFSFHQKQIMLTKLKQLKNSETRTSDLGETVSESSSGSSTFSFDQDAATQQDDIIKEQRSKDSETTERGHKVRRHGVMNLPAARDKTPRMYIKEIKVKAIERIKEKKVQRDPRKCDGHWYVVQVSWCDERTETIYRTYEEMFDFQCKLRKMFPNKVDENGNPWKLPFLPGRIRIFNKPDPKGEKTPIPDITEYIRWLLSSLPMFVRGCDHVVKFFQGSKPRSRKNSETKKSKGTLTTEGQCDRGKSKDFETPHKIAEAVREQSLGEKDNSKKKTAEKRKAKKQSQIIMSGARLSPGKKNIVDRLEPDENGNEVKALPRGFLLSTSDASDTGAIRKFGRDGLLQLHVRLPSSCVTSYPSPSESSNGSPVTSPISSPSFPQRSIKWAFRPHGRSMSVCEWLRRLRLHKYSHVFKGKTFDEMLKLSDADIEKLGLTTGARRKLRVNLEILRARGSFTSSGLTIVDIVPSLPSDFTQVSADFPLCCSGAADNEILHSFSELSDSASDCGSDMLSERGCIQTGLYRNIYSRRRPSLSNFQVSCYNCGSLGHGGGQCMAPNMDKMTFYGYHLRSDGQPESCL
ncbi:uncharacterized protein [Montipora capricornis]|uniref:uncharacterized protein isoform X2 n=1 Tax=Montipora capricornis TaxID=246305 RepID=UPI0035F20A2E